MVIFNSYVKLPEGSLLEQLLLLNSIPINIINYGLNPSPSQASPHGGGRDARRRGALKIQAICHKNVSYNYIVRTNTQTDDPYTLVYIYI